MLDDRKQRVLQAIIEEYIETAEPVSSGALVKNYGLDYSSATIRNDMADLESIGLLDKPHTSAGRIPSQKGYRFYVDKLVKGDDLSQDEIAYIKAKFATEAITEIISKITHYTSLLIAEADIKAVLLGEILDLPEFNKNPNMAKNFIKLLYEKEVINIINETQDISIYIGDETEYQDFSIITLNQEPIGTIGIIGPTRMDYSKVISVIKYIKQLGGY